MLIAIREESSCKVSLSASSVFLSLISISSHVKKDRSGGRQWWWWWLVDKSRGRRYRERKLHLPSLSSRAFRSHYVSVASHLNIDVSLCFGYIYPAISLLRVAIFASLNLLCTHIRHPFSFFRSFLMILSLRLMCSSFCPLTHREDRFVFCPSLFVRLWDVTHSSNFFRKIPEVKKTKTPSSSSCQLSFHSCWISGIHVMSVCDTMSFVWILSGSSLSSGYFIIVLVFHQWRRRKKDKMSATFVGIPFLCTIPWRDFKI